MKAVEDLTDLALLVVLVIIAGLMAIAYTFAYIVLVFVAMIPLFGLGLFGLYLLYWGYIFFGLLFLLANAVLLIFVGDDK
jgi:hypothetical protein